MTCPGKISLLEVDDVELERLALGGGTGLGGLGGSWDDDGEVGEVGDEVGDVDLIGFGV